MGGISTVERRHFLKLLGAGTGSAALVANGNSILTPTVAQAAVRSDTADAAVSEFIANPPFSFIYGGQSSAILLRQWRAVRRKISSSPGRSEERSRGGRRPVSFRFKRRSLCTRAYGATEWTVSFTNPSSNTSQQLSEVLAADTIINGSPRAPYVLHHFNGSAQRADDYAPQTSLLAPGTGATSFPQGGRPSNGDVALFQHCLGRPGVHGRRRLARAVDRPTAGRRARRTAPPSRNDVCRPHAEQLRGHR